MWGVVAVVVVGFGDFSVSVKPNGIRNPGVTSLRLTPVRALKEELEESKLCFPAKTSGDVHVTGGWDRGSLQEKGMYIWPEHP